MSVPRTISRRRVLTAMGAAGAQAAAMSLLPRAVAAQATTAAPTPSAGTSGGTTRPQYIFGYGSLVQRESRTSTVASAVYASPVVVTGIRRGWFDQFGAAESSTWSPTYLGAVADASATCNGVMFPVTPQEFEAYNARETGYQPTRIEPSSITMLDGSSSAPDADIWYYASVNQLTPTDEHPIVQSYVDVCLSGCLDLEAAYPLAKEAGFAEQFVRTTTDWQTPWINDRIYPWRPFVSVPRASTIDGLIRRVLGDELFNEIKLPGT
jgi:hypothetical protein